ncbi:hypothetical protein [Spirosoma luteum]|uniref:hypothetical protein n=1 Tax=Spirosoma luteum TaxID=431553 RepID=UPI00036ACBB2|nr:hypothetical protein [Spirosoma luteum]
MLTVRADRLSFTLPSSLDELTFGQSQALSTAEPADLRQILLILSALPESEFRTQTATLRRIEIADLINTHLSFIFDLADAADYPLPERVTIGGKVIAIPQKLGTSATVAQWWDLETKLDELKLPETGAPLHQIAPLLLSIFLCPAIQSEPYADIEQAYAVLPLIDSIPCTQALPIAAFFLSSYERPVSYGISYSKVTAKPRMMNWLNRRLSTFAAWTRSPIITRS